jgi:hypothetical protein
MRGLAHGILREGRMSALFESRICFVFEESRLTESICQKLRRISNLGALCHSRKLRVQILDCLHPVEEMQATDEGWRNDQGGIGVAKEVANQEPRPVAYGGGHEVQVGSEPGKRHLRTPRLRDLLTSVIDDVLQLAVGQPVLMRQVD